MIDFFYSFKILWVKLLNLRQVLLGIIPTQLRFRQRWFHFCWTKVSFSHLINLSLDKLPLALKSLICLHERHGDSPKYLPAKLRFFKHWNSLTEEQRAKEFGDDRLYQSSIQELKAIGITDNLDKLIEEALTKAKTSMEHATEYIKLRMNVVANSAENASKFQDLAITAL